MLFPNCILLSQCTFWCSVLSDPFRRAPSGRVCLYGLNAPSGAQCFPTDRRLCDEAYPDESQCTFWCSVLSDSETSPTCEAPCTVSMHLLVLSAFRLGHLGISDTRPFRLNAPSGAQCFPTGRIGFASSQSPDDCLNAPSGAQCFPTDEDGNLTQNPFDQVSMHLLVLSAFRQCTKRPVRLLRRLASQCTFWCSVLSDATRSIRTSPEKLVSMHLLVLSAFRLESVDERRQPLRSQCTFWCSVLSDPRPKSEEQGRLHPSQCTFWCSVLSDVAASVASSRFTPGCLNAPSGAQCFPTPKIPLFG